MYVLPISAISFHIYHGHHSDHRHGWVILDSPKAATASSSSFSGERRREPNISSRYQACHKQSRQDLLIKNISIFSSHLAVVEAAMDPFTRPENGHRHTHTHTDMCIKHKIRPFYHENSSECICYDPPTPSPPTFPPRPTTFIETAELVTRSLHPLSKSDLVCGLIK